MIYKGSVGTFVHQRRRWKRIILDFAIFFVLVVISLSCRNLIALKSEDIYSKLQKNETTSMESGTVVFSLSDSAPHTTAATDYNVKNANSTTSFNGFSFYLMGDTPYRDWQEKRLLQQIKEMNDYIKLNPGRNLSFTVHVGDIQKVSNTKCEELSYNKMSEILRKGKLPTLVTPGDNDWYDCPNRTESFNLFLHYFVPFEKRWHRKDYERLGIKRSSNNRELFVFYKEGILFIGIHLINAPIGVEDIDSWNSRMSTNEKWVETNVHSYFKRYRIRGVIIFGHSLRSPRTRPFFLSIGDNFVNITHRQNLPVLYLHGDGHDWDVDVKLSHQLHWKHFRDIQVDQGGLADPIIVDVAPSVKGKLKGLKQRNDLELVVGRGLFRIDRQRGKYDDPKSIE